MNNEQTEKSAFVKLQIDYTCQVFVISFEKSGNTLHGAYTLFTKYFGSVEQKICVCFWLLFRRRWFLVKT